MIVFSAVTKKFGEEITALQDISFSIELGELVVITGPSGSGKTTLMKLLIKEYLPSEGEILFDGEPLAEIRGSMVPFHRRQIGVIFQDYKLLPELNVWENIALPLSIASRPQEEIESRVTDLLKLTSLTERAWLFPGQLSGGEAQRVSIARALATGPRVIFADEPTGNLDAKTSLAITRLLEQINELGTTLLFSTHDELVLNQLSKNRRIVLDKGVVAEDTGAKSSVKTKKTKDVKLVVDEDDKPKTKLKLKLPKFKIPFGTKKKPKVLKLEEEQSDSEKLPSLSKKVSVKESTKKVSKSSTSKTSNKKVKTNS